MRIFRLAAIAFLFCADLSAAPKPKLLWFDATANFKRFSYPDSIRCYLDISKSLGITDIVLDVKPITGEVLWKSSVAPQMTEWNGFHRDPEMDFIQLFITEARSRNLRIHASLNIFCAGHNYFDRGIVYTTHPDWASIVYTDTGTFPITAVKKKYSGMTNPANPAVRDHEIAVLEELAARYPFDGIILDRVRFDGIEADFSALSRSLFEKQIGTAVDNFPHDIFEWKKNGTGKSSIVPGKYYAEWLEWRASLIHSFFERARASVKKIRPALSFGDYTGSWYPLYHEAGVNWASRKFDPRKYYPWASSTYQNTGYAELLDLYTSGNYYFEVMKDELLSKKEDSKTESGSTGGKEFWYSVEGSCEITREVLMGAVPVYGGLYVEQYKGNPEQFSAAVRICLKKSDGLMIFDIVHLISYGWWDVLQRAIQSAEKK